MLSLRTREMRDRDETLRRFRYKYTLIRIVFPTGQVLQVRACDCNLIRSVLYVRNCVMQGTFNTKESLSAVRDFVRAHIVLDWAPFELHDAAPSPTQSSLLSDANDARTLGDLGLMPAALLRFQLDADALRELSAARSDVQYLKPDTVSRFSMQ